MAVIRKSQITAGMKKLFEEQMGKLGFALNQLMTRDKVPMFAGKRRVILKKEAILSIEFADKLRQLTLDYKETGHGLRAAWCHVANEREANWFTMILLGAMGMISGSPDYWFVWEGGGGTIELKVDGDLSDEQVYFERWLQSIRANKAVHRTVEGALKSLAEWGAIV